MSKADFIAHVADAGDLTNAEAKRMVELVFGEIENGLRRARKEGKYTIGTFGTFTISKRPARIGTFGTFTISKRPARKGRNPRTGEEITIKASKSLRFRPSSALKEAAGC
jgi:DNA-binding protein HU-beta